MKRTINKSNAIVPSYDLIVVGAGHAGIEAALAAARMGVRTLLLSINLDTTAQMSCNPAIGGLAKGQMVREIDALGGEMAKAIDATGIHFKMLNRGRGPAVYSPRAQADKKLYQAYMKRILEEQKNLTFLQETVKGLIVENDICKGVRCESENVYRSQAVVITTGTFMRGLIHIGSMQTSGGRAGEPPSMYLSEDLKRYGIEIDRLKTGTPPRINGRTIDYTKLEKQMGEENPTPFSFSHDRIERPNVPCWITYTNETTHKIITDNIKRAPLYSGQIQATGPRYCPSIEVKVVRFADKKEHQIFLEPEGLDTHEVYCNGLATSIPCDVQIEMLHSIRGLEHAAIMRYGYAIEYDYVPPVQTKATLESKLVENLYLAGQINGTSGYEEAAGQGIIAGINAVRKMRHEPPLILDRSEAYIGVLIDDLVTKGVDEPYRMFTSRAEYRLSLRQDNADRRLMKYGYENGLIPQAQYERLQENEAKIAELTDYLENTRHGNKTLAQILKNPDKHFTDLLDLDELLRDTGYNDRVTEQVEIELKYEGYLKRQEADIASFKKLENKKIPQDLDYSAIAELRMEAREKLNRVHPGSLGQASRISGVTPADISVIMVHLEKRRRTKKVTTEQEDR